jgi:hypothetical protein
MTLEPALSEALAQLTADLELGTPDRVTRLPGGRNNRVFRVDAGGRQLLLKHYYSDPEDPRDRLAADFGFSSFAWQHGVRVIPEPLAAYPLLGIALYELVEGRRLEAADITGQRVDEAVSFIVDLNTHRGAPDAAGLPFAAEACFSVVDHMQCVGARLRRLQRVCDAAANEAAALVHTRLLPLWTRLCARADDGMDAAILRAAERCLSPSDFGFHNALLRNDRLVFHDFEYAGWDDPAKLVCDFFCQVERPVSMAFLEAFVDRVIDALRLPAYHRQRIAVLFPIYRVKWCCIVLNDFLPESARRRAFAGRGADPSDRRREQLQGATQLVEQLERDLDGLH